jgi:chemotaxis protein methyltransferase CheR
LANEVVLNRSAFFRQPSSFKYFEDRILPELRDISPARKALSFLSAGCSLGQEPYSLAMILDRRLGKRRPFKITGIDVNEDLLSAAETGMFPRRTASRQVPADLFEKYFVQIPGKSAWVAIHPDIREKIEFTRMNLTSPSRGDVSKYHTVFCRNVLCFFSDRTREKVLHWLYDHTYEGGYLIVSQWDPMERLKHPWTYVRPNVYRK